MTNAPVSSAATEKSKLTDTFFFVAVSKPPDVGRLEVVVNHVFFFVAVSKPPDVGRLEVVVKIMTEHKCLEAKERFAKKVSAGVQ